MLRHPGQFRCLLTTFAVVVVVLGGSGVAWAGPCAPGATKSTRMACCQSASCTCCPQAGSTAAPEVRRETSLPSIRPSVVAAARLSRVAGQEQGPSCQCRQETPAAPTPAPDTSLPTLRLASLGTALNDAGDPFTRFGGLRRAPSHSLAWAEIPAYLRTERLRF